MSVRRPALRLALAGLATGALLAALHLLGRGVLSTPPIGHPGQLGDWVRHHDSAVAAFSVLRLVALAAGWYLLAVIGLHFLAAAAHSHPLATAAGWITLPPVRRALVAMAGVGLTATTAAAGMPILPGQAATAVARQAPPSRPGWPDPQHGPVGSGPSGTATMRIVTPGGPGTATMRSRRARPGLGAPPGPPPSDPQPSEPEAGGGTATMRHLPPGPPGAPGVPASPGSSGTATLRSLPRHGAAAPPPAPAEPPPPTEPPRTEPPPPTQPPVAPAPAAAAAAVPSTWRVAAGDNFWHIAEATLDHAWGRPPTDAEIEPYWQAIIERNRASLARPDHPELILIGQVFELPPPPPRPTGR